MRFFRHKKSHNNNEILCPITGEVIDITQVQDPVFSGEAMGTGVGLLPQNNIIVSPVSGEVCMVFPTKHALGIKADNGAELLIHIGINTVELNGEGFKSSVKQGMRVEAGQKLVEIDLSFIREKGYDPTVMLIFTDDKGMKITKNLGEHTEKDVIMTLA